LEEVSPLPSPSLNDLTSAIVLRRYLASLSVFEYGVTGMSAWSAPELRSAAASEPFFTLFPVTEFGFSCLGPTEFYGSIRFGT
jgi:hypothetical protein